MASTIINYIDRQTLSVLAPYLKHDYGWNSGDFAKIVISEEPRAEHLAPTPYGDVLKALRNDPLVGKSHDNDASRPPLIWHNNRANSRKLLTPEKVSTFDRSGSGRGGEGQRSRGSQAERISDQTACTSASDEAVNFPRGSFV
jgi:hypothetical protein